MHGKHLACSARESADSTPCSASGGGCSSGDAGRAVVARGCSSGDAGGGVVMVVAMVMVEWC